MVGTAHLLKSGKGEWNFRSCAIIAFKKEITPSQRASCSVPSIGQAYGMLTCSMHQSKMLPAPQLPVISMIGRAVFRTAWLSVRLFNPGQLKRAAPQPLQGPAHRPFLPTSQPSRAQSTMQHYSPPPFRPQQHFVPRPMQDEQHPRGPVPLMPPHMHYQQQHHDPSPFFRQARGRFQ